MTILAAAMIVLTILNMLLTGIHLNINKELKNQVRRFIEHKYGIKGK